MTRTVLVTGASGFVGRQVVRTLLQQGAQVRVVVRTGKQEQLESPGRLAAVTPTPDLFAENAQWWTSVCEGVDTVVHVAWYAEPGKYLHSPLNLDCLMGTLQLAKGAAQAGARRFVGIGTCFEYDLAAGVLGVDAPLHPLTPYAAAKAAAFMALTQYLPTRHVEFAWCRLFYLYGEGEDPRRLASYLRKQLAAGGLAELTSGDQIRDFLDVEEAAGMIVEVAQSGKTGPVNICSGIPVTIRAFAEKIADDYGGRHLLKFGTHARETLDPPCVVGVK